MNIHSCAKRGDIEGVKQFLAAGISVDTRHWYRQHSPLMFAAGSPDAGVAMLHFLIAQDANLHLCGRYGRNALSLALREGNPAKVSCLLDAGAPVDFQTKLSGSAFGNAFSRNVARDERLPELVALLLAHGAEIGGDQTFADRFLSTLAGYGRFDIIQQFIAAGADPSSLKWTPLMRVLVYEGPAELAQFLLQEPNLSEVDRCGRTPLLLSVLLGNIEKTLLLLAAGASLVERGPHGMTPLLYALMAGKAAMLQWLLGLGVDPDEADDERQTPLMLAAKTGNLACIRALLTVNASVHMRDAGDYKAIYHARDLATASLLANCDADWMEVKEIVRRERLGFIEMDELDISEAQFHQDRRRSFGKANPQRQFLPFCDEIIRSGFAAWVPRLQFACEDEEKVDAVWSYERFGRSTTTLPDGRIVEIGGEHEDFYDQDFCIYNDVVLHKGGGNFQLFAYPAEDFPPTDFHSATLVGQHIYIIGRLGYGGTREFGQTPIYRLDLNTFAIESVATTGQNPGWIYEHRAHLVGEHIVLNGGKIAVHENDDSGHVENQEGFALDLQTLCWHKRSTQAVS